MHRFVGVLIALTACSPSVSSNEIAVNDAGAGDVAITVDSGTEEVVFGACGLLGEVDVGLRSQPLSWHPVNADVLALRRTEVVQLVAFEPSPEPVGLREVARVGVPGGCFERACDLVVQTGDTLWFPGVGNLAAVDVSDPRDPQLLGSVPLERQMPSAFHTDGRHAVTFSRATGGLSSELVFYDTSDPAGIIHQASIDVGGGVSAMEVLVADGVAIVAGAVNGVSVGRLGLEAPATVVLSFDLSTSPPRIVGRFTIAAAQHEVPRLAWNSGQLFVLETLRGTGDSRLLAIDASDPADLTLTAETVVDAIASEITSLVAVDERVYLATTGDGVAVFDGNLGRLGGGLDDARYGKRLVVASDGAIFDGPDFSFGDSVFRVLDVSQPETVDVAATMTSAFRGAISGIEADRGQVWLPAETGEMTRVDASDPVAMGVVDDALGEPTGTLLDASAGRLATNDGDGLRVWSVEDPETPEVLQRWAGISTRWPADLVMTDTHVVISGTQALTVLNIVTGDRVDVLLGVPVQQPWMMAGWRDTVQLLSVVAYGVPMFAFMDVTAPEGLRAVDLSGEAPFVPANAGMFAAEFTATQNYAFAVGIWAGQSTSLVAWDVTDRSSPLVVGEIEMSAALLQGMREGTVLAVADGRISALEVGEGGLETVDTLSLDDQGPIRRFLARDGTTLFAYTTNGVLQAYDLSCFGVLE